jgi:hypothetical protein
VKKIIALNSFVFLLAVYFPCFAQENDKVKTSTLVWWGFRNGTNFVFMDNYRTQGRSIIPDVGWVDFGKSHEYREVFAGGGYIPVNNKRFSLVTEGFFLQGTGLTRNRPNYFLAYVVSGFKPVARLNWETNYFGYYPINKTAQVQHVLDRSKLEWQFSDRFALGGGFAGCITKGTKWDSMPFASAKLSTKDYGNFEIWLQKVPPPYNYRFQLRFNKTR